LENGAISTGVHLEKRCRMLHKFERSILVFLVLSLCGCQVGPDYQRPKLAMPTHYKEAPPGWKTAEPRDAMDKGSWWLVFNDPDLNLLMEKVNVSNQNIIVAVAQYREAVASLAQSESYYLPTLTVDANVNRQKTASDVVGVLTRSSVFDQYTPNAAIAWAPDLFGAVGRAVEAARAGAQASAAQIAETRLSMQATLAQTYFQLRAADLIQKFLDDTVFAYKKSLQLTKNQYASGIASRLAIVQAESQLQTAETAALDNGIIRAQYEHAIAVLIGETPEQFILSSRQLELSIPSIPLEIPASLLERRPDIAAAERTLVQANANIGVAVAAYFPLLNLTGNYGWQANVFQHLFHYPTLMWALGATVTETIFDGGLRRAQEESARAIYDQNVATYKQTVLSALQNVEDNLVALRVLDAEVTVQNAAVTTADRALEITMNQYNAGIVDYANVIQAQTTAYNAKGSAIDIYSRRLVASVGLIQALGGGWNTDAVPNLQCTTAVLY